MAAAVAGGKCETCGKWRSQDILDKGGGCFYHPEEPVFAEEETRETRVRKGQYPCCGKELTLYYRVKRRTIYPQGCVEADHIVEGISGGSGQMTKSASKK